MIQSEAATRIASFAIGSARERKKEGILCSFVWVFAWFYISSVVSPARRDIFVTPQASDSYYFGPSSSSSNSSNSSSSSSSSSSSIIANGSTRLRRSEHDVASRFQGNLAGRQPVGTSRATWPAGQLTIQTVGFDLQAPPSWFMHGMVSVTSPLTRNPDDPSISTNTSTTSSLAHQHAIDAPRHEDQKMCAEQGARSKLHSR